ncbi:MAG: hypothetical protein QM796_11860 [Chthoniobacteraceae bacterium]
MEHLFVFLIIAIIVYFKAMKAKGGAAQNAPREQRPETARPNPTAAQSSQAEQERLRKFLQALGVPADQLPPAPFSPPPGQVKSVRPPPIVMREAAAPQPPSKKKYYPQTPPISGPVGVPGRKIPPFLRQEPPPLAPPPAPVTPPPFEPVSQPVPVAAVPAFTEPSDAVGATDGLVTASDLVSPGNESVRARARIQDFLRNSDDLRRAMILREIFNPPKGLQLPGDAIHSRLV